MSLPLANEETSGVSNSAGQGGGRRERIDGRQEILRLAFPSASKHPGLLLLLLTNHLLIGFTGPRSFALIPACAPETARGPSVDGGSTATDSRFTSSAEDWSLAERRSLDQQTVTARRSRRRADDDGADGHHNHHSPGSNSWDTSRSCS